MKSYGEYKKELESILEKINSSHNFEEMAELYEKGSAIIQILEKKISQQKKVISKVIKK